MAVIILLSSLVSFSLISDTVSASSTLYVGGAGPGNYTTIQSAIDNATSGDTVFVYNGTYFENVIVNKTLNLLGENRDTTIVNGGGSGTAIFVSNSNVTIEGFWITGSGSNFFDAGIKLEIVQDCKIENNTVINNKQGIYLDHSNGNLITDNVANSNYCGIYQRYSENCTIANNTANSNSLFGIYLYTSSKNNVENNTVNSNGNSGISLYSSSERNSVVHNSVSDTTYGFFLSSSSNNNIIKNNVTNNGLGIYLWSSSDNNIIDNNNVFFNTITGIDIYGNGNTIYHNNLISNNWQGHDAGVNYWDIGYPLGGNYWSDYSGVDNFSGPGQNETGSDGMGDTPYTSIGGGAGAQDNYPQMEPWPPDRAIMDLFKEASPHHAYVNDTVTYWINYSNSGSKIAHNVTVNETYPEEVSFISAIPPPDVGNNIWLIGDVDCGQSGSIMINVSVTSAGIGIITNEVSLFYYNETGHKLPTEYEEVTINTDAGPVHNIDKDLYYIIIQEAIDEADNGNTIEVDAGIYNEHVIVNKTLNLIGESRDTTFIDGEGSGNVVYVNANWINISEFSIINGNKGLVIKDANDCSIDSNNISNNSWYGIDYDSICDGNNFTNNIISNNYYGIEPFNRDIILNNQILNNDIGIYFRFRTNLTIVNNSMVNCGLLVDGYKFEHWISHNVYNNTVNGRPLYYWKNRTAGIIPSGAGQVILVNCTNVVVKNQNLSNASVGIELGFSSYNTVIKNYFANEIYRGLYAVMSDNNMICQNNASNNDIGMHLKTSHNNIICSNNLSYCRQSINIEGSDKNNVINNKMCNCTEWNVVIWLSSYYNEIFNNDISNNTGNFNKGIYLGTNPRYNNITYNKFYNTFNAIELYLGVLYNRVEKNTIINCDYGITTIATNNIYHNSIINTPNPAWDSDSANWDNGYPSAGNYWSDYSGIDLFSGPNQDIPGSDGIGDTPYTNISGGTGSKDNYPLMNPLDCEPPASFVNPILPYWQSSSPITLNATANDNDAVTNVTLWYRYSSDNISWGSWICQGVDLNSPWSWNFDFLDGDGFYGFATRANDSSGNPETPNNIICSEDVLIGYDTTAPNVYAGPDVIINSQFYQDATANDTSGIATYQWTQETGPGTIIFGTPNEEDTTVSADIDGTYVLRLNVTDNASHSNFDDFTLIWDTVKPTITLNTPSNNSLINAGVIIDFDVTDAYLNNVKYFVDGGANQTLGSPYDIGTSGWIDGTYIIEVHAIDDANNTAVEIYSFTIDATAPMVISTNPTNNTTGISIFQPIVIQFNEAMNISSVLVNQTNGTDSGGWSWFWNKDKDTITGIHDAWPRGENVEITVQAGYKDDSNPGNVNNTDYIFSFTTETNPSPNIIHTNISSPQELGDEIRVNATITDDGTVMNAVLWWQDVDDVWHENYMDKRGDDWEYLIPAQMTMGTVKYQINATDDFGQKNSTMIYEFDIRDLTPPVITHTPVESAVVGEAINITCEIIDLSEVNIIYMSSGVFFVYRYEGDTDFIFRVMNPEYWYEIPAHSAPATIEYYIWASDIYGNQATTNVYSLEILDPDTTPPEVLLTTPTGDNIPVSSDISIVFSEAMNQTAVESAISISPTISGVSYNWLNDQTLVIEISGNLSYNTTYTITIDTGAKDLAGNTLASDYTWQFSTVEEPEIVQSPVSNYWWWIIALILIVIIMSSLFVIRRMPEPQLKTTLCPICGFDVEAGSPCPFCVEETPEPSPEPEPHPNQEILDKIEKAYQEGKLTEKQYQMNLEKFGK